MTEPSTALLSVRGEARTTVSADSALMHGVLTVTQQTKAAALGDAAAALQGLTDDLASLGGSALAADTVRRPLTWSAHSATTEAEHDYDEATGRSRRTGRIVASVSLSIAVREFDLLDRLDAVLARHEDVRIHHVSWDVADNPSWPQVRSDAIRAAIAKGRDYATALGGSLVRVEHIADVGLLGGADGFRENARAAGVRMAYHAGGMETPSLDPVPQELVAAIDARFISTVAAL